jgi:hypothetical protein
VIEAQGNVSALLGELLEPRAQRRTRAANNDRASRRRPRPDRGNAARVHRSGRCAGTPLSAPATARAMCAQAPTATGARAHAARKREGARRADVGAIRGSLARACMSHADR